MQQQHNIIILYSSINFECNFTRLLNQIKNFQFAEKINIYIFHNQVSERYFNCYVLCVISHDGVIYQMGGFQ